MALAPVCAPTEVAVRYDPFLFFFVSFAHSHISLYPSLVPRPQPHPLHAALTPPGCIGHSWSHQCPVGSAHYVVPLGPIRHADAHGMCTLLLCPCPPCPSPRICAHSHDCTTTGGSAGGGLFSNTALTTTNQPQPQTGGGGGSLFGSSTSNQPQSQSGGRGGGLFGSGSSTTNQRQQPETGGGLFGGRATNTTTAAQGQPPQQTGGGLFGSATTMAGQFVRVLGLVNCKCNRIKD